MKHRAFLASFSAVLVLAQASAADFEQNIGRNFNVTPGGKFILDADQGSVEIKTDDRKDVVIRVLRKVKDGNKAEADELFKNHEVSILQDGNEVRITAKNRVRERSSWARNHSYLEVRYEINLPNKFHVDLKTAGGNIDLDDLGGTVVARTSSGSIKLGKISGSVDASDAGGNISIAEAGGELTAKTSSGSITVQKAVANAQLSDAGGNIKVEEAGAELKASTTSGSIKIGQVKANVDVKNAGGDILIASAGANVKASTSSGYIRVGEVKGEVKLTNAGGNVEVGQAGANVAISTSSGTIKVESVKASVVARNAGGGITLGTVGSTVTAETSSGSVNLKSARGRVEIKNSGGNIFVDNVDTNATLSTTSGTIKVGSAAGKLDIRNAGGSVEVVAANDAVNAQTTSGQIVVNFVSAHGNDSKLDVSGGGIKVTLPATAKVDLDARTSGGVVVSENLPITVQVESSKNRDRMQGKINGGGPELILRASSGDIRLIGTTPVPQRAEAEK